MRALAEFPREARRAIRFVLLDIDDTLTTEGRLSADAYAALERLTQHGLHIMPVTGRPAGWCDMIARFWPVDAVIGENGAFYFRYDHQARMTLYVSQVNGQDEKILFATPPDQMPPIGSCKVAG